MSELEKLASSYIGKQSRNGSCFTVRQGRGTERLEELSEQGKTGSLPH